MALSKVDYNSLNVTAAASKALKWNSGADGFETGDVAGSMVLIKTLTASSSATLSFVDGTDDVVLDSTYPIYLFKTINAHPATDQAALAFQANVAGGSGYNETITSSIFQANHNETGGDSGLTYHDDYHQAQATGFQRLYHYVGNDNDQSTSGELWLFNPSSTTFVKHFISTFNCSMNIDVSNQDFVAGYCNTTSAVDAVIFKLASGTLDGVIKLYGVT